MMLFALDKLSCGWIVTGSEVIKLTICMVLFSVAVNLIRLQFACHQADAFIVPVSLHSKFARWCDRIQIRLAALENLYPAGGTAFVIRFAAREWRTLDSAPAGNRTRTED